MTHRDFQVSRVVCGKVVGPRKWENPGHRLCSGLRILENRQAVKQLDELPNFGFADSFAPLANQQRVGDLHGPDCRDDKFLVFDFRQHCVRKIARFIREAPGERDRGVDYDPAQCFRPSATISRTLCLPGFTRLRRALILSTISPCAILRFASSTGTKFATGTPCLVIVMRSPRATRSSSSDKCV